MTLDEKLRLSYYKEIAKLNEEHDIFLVQHIETHKVYVMKKLARYNPSVYEKTASLCLAGLPHICELFEEDDCLIVIEEYISGHTLQELLDTQGTFSESEVVSYAMMLCDILSPLHASEPPIIHRDLKPSNIMLTPRGDIILLDLNAAKYVDASQEEDTVLLGTKGYAAPEQYGFGSSNEQTDIYALGMTMNVLLTGSVTEKYAADNELQNIIKTCTQLNPEDRYQSVTELSDRLKSLISPADTAFPKTDADSETGNTLPEKRSYVIPGFRSKNILHMMLAVFGYAFILWCGLSLEVIGETSLVFIWANRLCFTTAALLSVAFNCNYLDIQHYLPVYKITSRTKRWACYVAIDALILFLCVFLLAIFESLL